MTKLIILIAAVAGLALAPVASADVFTGPWDSAHQPPDITNPKITAGASTVTEFDIDIDASITCDQTSWPWKPIPGVTVTVADASGSITQDVSAFGCSGPATTTTTTGTPDFGVQDLGVVHQVFPSYQPRVGAICWDNTRSSATSSGACSYHGGVRDWLYAPGQPFLWTVSDANGILAQGAMTGLSTHGWPAPPPPPLPPAPAPAPAPKPAPKPVTKPKPVPTLTQTHAVGYLKTALHGRFRRSFPGHAFRARCARTSSTSFTCRPQWAKGKARFSGTARVWLTSTGQHHVTTRIRGNS